MHNFFKYIFIKQRKKSTDTKNKRQASPQDLPFMQL